MKDDKVFIKHILDEIAFIRKTTGTLHFEEFIRDEILKRAIARSLEIIGEATKNLSKEFKEKHSEIEWRELAGLRDKLIHQYFGVNWRRVWDVIETLVPEIQNKLNDMIF